MKTVFLPRSLSELWDHIEAHSEACFYAGGTDLLVKMRSGIIRPSVLICLERLEELKGVKEEEESVRIGSCTTFSHLERHPAIRKHFAVLAQAVAALGSPPIRNMGTIGGNICTASPAGDTLPPLYVLGAEVDLQSINGSRRVAIRDFITDPGTTSLAKGEILTAVWIKKPTGFNVHHFEKVGQRNALACATASMAAMLEIARDGVVQKAALAWGSVAPTVAVCSEAEEVLIGEKLSAERLKKAAALVRDAVRPISDLRADADYRRIVSGNLLLRLVEVAAAY